MELLDGLYRMQFTNIWLNLSYVLFFIAIGMILIRKFDISLVKGNKSLSKKLITNRFRRDIKAAKEREQLELIGIKPTGFKKQYIDLVQSILISLRLERFAVESFTTFLIFIGFLLLLFYSIIFDSIFLGILVTVPSIEAIVAIIILITKNKVRANDNNVMDSLDVICPTIQHSVTAAIRQNLDAFDSSIRVHYQNFLYDIETRGLLFREAMLELNRKLGPRFDEFAKLAIMFHESGDLGMSAMFMDIVDMNNTVRSMNAKSDVVFRKANLNLLGSSISIIAFLFYAYINPMTGVIMRETGPGKLVGAIVIASLIRTFAKIQISQMTLKYDDVYK